MRPVRFVGSARADLRAFPDAVRHDVGQALYQVKLGETPLQAKPMHGLGSGVAEIAEDGEGGTYRAVYTVSLTSAVYVLHAFQKKSPRGSQLPRGDAALIRSRLAWARHMDAALQTQGDDHG